MVSALVTSTDPTRSTRRKQLEIPTWRIDHSGDNWIWVQSLPEMGSKVQGRRSANGGSKFRRRRVQSRGVRTESPEGEGCALAGLLAQGSRNSPPPARLSLVSSVESSSRPGLSGEGGAGSAATEIRKVASSATLSRLGWLVGKKSPPGTKFGSPPGWGILFSIGGKDPRRRSEQLPEQDF